jgi:putative transcriptional regulator
MINHHLSDSYVIEYANGTLANPEALIVGSHIAMCGECRGRVQTCEDVSAVLLEDGNSEEPSANALSDVLAKIDEPTIKTREGDEGERQIMFDQSTLEVIPPPLREYLNNSLSSLDWKRTGRGIEEASLLRENDVKISLLRIRAGQKVPSHTHGGDEFTLLLDGGYSDGDEHYGKGDVSVADSATDHAPVADSDGPCLCLTVSTGAPRLTGPIGRFLNLLVRN